MDINTIIYELDMLRAKFPELPEHSNIGRHIKHIHDMVKALSTHTEEYIGPSKSSMGLMLNGGQADDKES